MKKIIFVCTGNTCRSPMAEGIFNTALAGESELLGKFEAASAGMAPGSHTEPNAIEVLGIEYGIDISGHIPRRIDATELKSAYLILTMENKHKYDILMRYPELRDKVFTINEFSGIAKADIGDPFLGGLEIYRQCALEIRKVIDLLIDKLKNDKSDLH